MASRKIVNNLTVALHQLFVHSVLNKVLGKHYTFSVLYFHIYTSITLQAKVDRCGSHERLRQRIKCLLWKKFNNDEEGNKGCMSSVCAIWNRK